MSRLPSTPRTNVHPSRRWIIVLLVVALIAAAAFWLLRGASKANDTDQKTDPNTANAAADSTANSSANSTKTSSAQPSLTVQVTTASQVHWPQLLAANGNVAAWQQALIGSELSGLRITSVLVNIGDRVRQGQVLATLNAETIDAELRQSLAAKAEAVAVLAGAEADAKRAQSLKNSGALSSSEVNQYLTAAATAQARLQAAEARISSDQLRRKNSTIISADDGIITERNATVGALTQQGQALFTLIRDGRLEWRAEVLADDLPQLSVGMPVHILSSNSANTMPIRGTLRSIGPVVDPKTRQAVAYVDLPPQSPLKAGMYVKGEFVQAKQAALVLPQSAVVLRDGFSYVFVVLPNNRVQQLKVELGRRMAEQVEVRGIDANARVVVSGGAFLSDGDVVRVAAQASSATAQPAKAAEL